MVEIDAFCETFTCRYRFCSVKKHFCKVNFFPPNLQNTIEKFGGKKFTWQKSEFYFAKQQGPYKLLCKNVF
jgi:hypothetical protein